MAVDPNFNWVRSLVQGNSTENLAGTKWPTTVTGSTAGTDYLGLANGDLTVSPTRTLSAMEPADMDTSGYSGSLYVLRQLMIQNLPTWTPGARVLEGEDFAIRYSSTVGRMEVISMPQEASLYVFDVPTTGAYSLEVNAFSAWGYLTTGYNVYVNRNAMSMPYYPSFAIYNSPPTRAYVAKTGYTRVGGGGLDKTLTPAADFTIAKNLVTQGYPPASSAVPQGLALAKDIKGTSTEYPAISGRVWPPGLGYSVDIFPVSAASSTSTYAPSTYASGSITWRIGAGTTALPYFTATVNVAGLTWVQAATIAGQSLAAQVNAAFPALKPAVTHMSSSNERIGTTEGSFSYSWAGGTWGGLNASTFPGGSATGTRTGTIYRYYDMAAILLPLTGPTTSWPAPEISYTDIVYSSGVPPYSAAFAPIPVYYSTQTVPATYGLGAGLPSTITLTITGASNADNGAAIMPTLGSGTVALAVATTPSALDAANFFAGKLETEATSNIVTFGNTASLTLVTKSPMTVTQAMLDQVAVGRRVPTVSGVDRLYGFRLTLSKSENMPVSLPWATSAIPPATGSGNGPTVWDSAYDLSLGYGEANRLASSWGGYHDGFARTAVSKTSGLWYFEVIVPEGGTFGTHMVGAGSPGAAMDEMFPGGTGTDCAAYYISSNAVYTNSLSPDYPATAADATTVVGVLIDAANRTVAWKGATTTTATYAIPGTGPIYGVFGDAGGGGGVSARINAGQSAFALGLPSGYAPLEGPVTIPGDGVSVPSNVLFAVSANNGYIADQSQYGLTPQKIGATVTVPTSGSRTSDGYISNTDGNSGVNARIVYSTTDAWRTAWATATAMTFEYDVYNNQLDFAGGQFMNIENGHDTQAWPGGSGVWTLLPGVLYMANGTSATLNHDTWYHIAFVADGVAREVRLYVDGVLTDTQTGVTAGVFNWEAYPTTTNNISLLQLYSMSSNGSLNGKLDNIVLTATAKYTANFTPPTTFAEAVAGTDIPSSADITGAGYNDIEELTSFGTGNTQATDPDSYGISATDLDDFTVNIVAYIDAADITGTGTTTLAAFTNVGDGVAAIPTDLTGDPTGQLDDFTSAADGVADFPLEFTADYTLGDITSVAVGLFLAPSEGSGDGMLDDIVQTTGEALLIDPVVYSLNATVPVATLVFNTTQFFVNATVPAATLNAEVSQYEGFKLDGAVPAASMAGWFGMRLNRNVPWVTLLASGSVPNTLRLSVALPRVTIQANILDGRKFNLNARLPVATLSAWTGWQLAGTVPAATVQGNIVVGGAYTLIADVPKATLMSSISTVNVLSMHAVVPAAARAGWLALSCNVPAARLLARISAVQAITRVAYSFTLANSAMTRYPAYPFVQLIRMGNAYYGVADDGLYEIGGETDNGTSIPWAWETCMTDFGVTEKKTVVSAYLGGYVPQSMTYTIKAGDVPTGANAHATTATAVLRNHRQKFGIGRKSRFFAFGLSATQGRVAIESIEFEVANMSRRV